MPICKSHFSNTPSLVNIYGAPGTIIYQIQVFWFNSMRGSKINMLDC